jgi:hypothetical protein
LEGKRRNGVSLGVKDNGLENNYPEGLITVIKVT